VDKDAVGKIHAYRIEVSLNYPKLKPPRGGQGRYIMEILVEGFGMTEKELVRFNRVRKYLQAMFLLDIATTKGDKINNFACQTDDKHTMGSLGGNRSTIMVGMEHPTKDN
jgi:hypothetical protein